MTLHAGTLNWKVQWCLMEQIALSNLVYQQGYFRDDNAVIGRYLEPSDTF